MTRGAFLADELSTEARREPITVLIVDDSPLMQGLISAALSFDPDIKVVGVAANPHVARAMIKELSPQVLTLDIEMPGMNGLDFLEKIMTLRPMPVVMISSLTKRSTEETLEALELGAVDYVAKPGSSDGSDLAGQTLENFQSEVVRKVKGAALARVRALATQQPAPRPKTVPALPWSPFQGQIAAIGGSTGAVDALRDILLQLPAGTPPILVTLHMPEMFTASFAARLNRDCAIEVVEAEDGMAVIPGRAILARGGRQMEIAKRGHGFVVRVYQGGLISGHQPSVDVLFKSFAQHVGKRGKGVILTGMGKDGAIGLKEMRDAGADTAGQNEATSLVYGMPKVAMQMGGVARELSLGRIADWIMSG